MAEQITLRLEHRTVLGKQVKALRRAGITPVHLYGRGIASRSLQAPSSELLKVLARAGRNTPITVTIAGSHTSDLAMVRDVQREPVNRTPLHVDLLRVDLEQLITVEVRLVLKGDSPGARLAGGSVAQRMYYLEVEARPLDLPHQLEVDLAGLAEANSVLRAGDVPLPSNVALVTNPEAIVAAIEVAREEVVEEAAVAEEGAAEPEVIRPARAEEEEEEK